jgi:hypothetical protein
MHSESHNFPKFPTHLLKIHFKINHNMLQQNNEAQLNLALQAIQQDPKLSVRRAVKVYLVDHSKLSRQLRGIPSRHAFSANSLILTDLEE